MDKTKPIEEWVATGKPNDYCCWEAHIETKSGDPIADVCDLETAKHIVYLRNLAISKMGSD